MIPIQKRGVSNNLHVIHSLFDTPKAHHISFLAWVTSNKLELLKLYPEQNAEGRFRLRGHGLLYLYCNKHGLMKRKL